MSYTRPRFPQSKEEQERAIAEFADIGPFTITITKHEDLLYLQTACLMQSCNHDRDFAKQVLLMMARGAAELGSETAVTMCLDAGRERGYKFPDFFKPLVIALLEHGMASAKKKKEKGNNNTAN